MSFEEFFEVSVCIPVLKFNLIIKWNRCTYFALETKRAGHWFMWTPHLKSWQMNRWKLSWKKYYKFWFIGCLFACRTTIYTQKVLCKKSWWVKLSYLSTIYVVPLVFQFKSVIVTQPSEQCVTNQVCLTHWFFKKMKQKSFSSLKVSHKAILKIWQQLRHSIKKMQK